MSTYGPFVDEELFYYHDRTTLALDELKIYREGVGLIGFNDLEVIHNQGRKGSFGKVFFSGIMTLSTVFAPFSFPGCVYIHVCLGGYFL